MNMKAKVAMVCVLSRRLFSRSHLVRSRGVGLGLGLSRRLFSRSHLVRVRGFGVRVRVVAQALQPLTPS